MAWVFHSNTEAHDFTFTQTINAGATHDIAYSAGTFAVGDLLVLELGSGFSALSFTITDDQGNTWTEVVAGGLDRGDGYRTGLWWAIATTAVQPTVHLHNTSGSATQFYIAQVCSWTPPNPSTETVDNINTASGTSTAAIASVSTAGVDELIVGFGLSTTGFPTGAHSGSTGTCSYGSTYPMTYRNEAVAGSYNVGNDFGSSAAFGCIGVSFSAPAPPSGSGTMIMFIMT